MCVLLCMLVYVCICVCVCVCVCGCVCCGEERVPKIFNNMHMFIIIIYLHLITLKAWHKLKSLKY